jgi:Universal stress protein family.
MKTSRVSRARAQQRLIRTILVPVDFSDCSLAGLTYAVRFAKEIGARIVVVHVADLGPVMMTTGRGDYDSPTYIEAARRRCGDQMKGFLKRVSFDGVPVECVCRCRILPRRHLRSGCKGRCRSDHYLDAWPNWFAPCVHWQCGRRHRATFRLPSACRAVIFT